MYRLGCGRKSPTCCGAKFSGGSQNRAVLLVF